ncbi:oligosaccharide flippase family protein [Ornithinimicrobium panacihumi]|uniref:oligosaccharide flippase family protein n=1 Tax=Ornithinimicrobium panacihumi TaxID=2008449 RepID=UPI003F89FF31
MDGDQDAAGERSEALDRGQLQRRAVRGALWTGIHTLVSLPLAFLVNILVARVLGVADYGRLTYLTTVITIASVIAGLGVTTALVQFGAKAHAAGDHGDVKRLLSGAQGFRLLVSGPLVALAVISLVRLDWWLLMVALVFGVGAPALFGTAKEALTIENRTDRTAQLAMIGNALSLAAVTVAVLTLGTPDAVWGARTVVSGLVLALPLISISQIYRGAVLRPGAPWRLPRSFWRFAIPTGIAGMIGALVSNRTELVLLDWFADEVAMGLFGLAFGVAGHVYAPAQAFVGPLVPAVSALARVDQGAVRRAFLRTTRAASAVGGAVVATVLPAMACLVPLIYGTEYAPASDMTIALGLAGAVTLVGAPHQAFLMARLGGGRMLYINLAGLAVDLAVALALIPLVGVWGAVLACAAAMIVRALMQTVGEARALDVRWRELLQSLGALLLGCLLAVLAWLVVRSTGFSAPVQAAAVAGISGGAFIAGLRISRTGLSAADVRAITGAFPARLRPMTGALLTPLRGSRADQ